MKRAVQVCKPGIVDPGQRAVDARLSHDLGGCMPKAARLAVPELMMSPGGALPRLRLLSEPERVADELQCMPGRTPSVDLSRNTHAILVDVMLSSEHPEIVAAVDDGESVHVGVRRTKVCQGVMPFDRVNASVLTLPGPGRRVVVHTCAPRYPTCGAVP